MSKPINPDDVQPRNALQSALCEIISAESARPVSLGMRRQRRARGDTFAASARESVTRNPGAYYAKVWDRTGADGRALTAGRY